MAVYESKKNESQQVITGKVVKLRKGTGKAAGRLLELVVKTEVYDAQEKRAAEKEFSIACWNGEKNNLADRVEKMKIREDSDVVILAYADTDEKGGIKYNAIRVGYPGTKFEFGDEESKNTVLFGYVGSVRRSDNVCSVSISIRDYRDGETCTDWYSVGFFNEQDGQQRADNAEKVIKKGDLISVFGSAVKEKTIGDKTYRDISGYRFDILKKKAENS